MTSAARLQKEVNANASKFFEVDTKFKQINAKLND